MISKSFYFNVKHNSLGHLPQATRLCNATSSIIRRRADLKVKKTNQIRNFRGGEQRPKNMPTPTRTYIVASHARLLPGQWDFVNILKSRGRQIARLTRSNDNK